MQRAVGVDREARHAAVEQRDGPSLERLELGRRAVVDGDPAVGEVLDQRGDRRVEAVRAGDDEHRQRAHAAQVGARAPILGQRRRRRHPHPRLAAGVQLPLSSSA